MHLLPDDVEDLWHAYNLICVGDAVSGTTYRKIDSERERQRETERQRDRETERQRDRETERQRDRETEIV